MQTSPQMRKLIEGFEGCRLNPYQDSVGVWTIGFGHTGDDVYQGCGAIDQATADQMLADDLTDFENSVSHLCPKTTQQQFDALVSFSYNLGSGALQNSTLRRKHNAGDHAGAAAEFGRWNHAGGRVLAGLTRRRAAEAAVYSHGNYSA